jgi:hypothetical protein
MSPDKSTKSITLLGTFHWNSPWYSKDKISNMFQSGRLNHSKLISAVWVRDDANQRRCTEMHPCLEIVHHCCSVGLSHTYPHSTFPKHPLQMFCNMENKQLVMKCHGELRPHTIHICCVRGHMRFDAGADSGVCRFLHVPIRMFQESIADQIVPSFVSGSVLQTAIHGGCSDGWDGPRSHTRFSAKLHVYRGHNMTILPYTSGRRRRQVLNKIFKDTVLHPKPGPAYHAMTAQIDLRFCLGSMRPPTRQVTLLSLLVSHAFSGPMC